MNKSKSFDIVIAGGGLAGLTAANALSRIGARAGLKIALVAPNIDEPDGRTTALLAHSVDYLKEIEVWDHALPKAAIMSVMRIIDNTKRLLHAPEVAFKSVEIGLDAFGYNILNTDLSAALRTSLKKCNNFQHIKGKIVGAVEGDDAVSIKLESGEVLRSQLIIGADGRNSTVRSLADGGKGIGVREWSYPQTAIVLNFSHTLPHNNTSTEFHNSSGPFTVVPLEEQVSSLVWVVKPEVAEQIIARKSGVRDNGLDRDIEEQMHSILGKTKVITTIQSFPLSGMNARKLAKGRFILVGEAGHVFPPIGAQGYNLGIRDIEELARLVVNGIGDPYTLASRYNSRRQADVISRTLSVDLFNRSLLSGFLPVQALRSAGIMALNEIGPLRKMMMREGVSPGLGVAAISGGVRYFCEIFQSSRTHS